MFSEWIDRARLEGILLGLAAAMRLASRIDESFKEDLRERNGIAELRTEDRDVSRSFRISRGSLCTPRGSHPNPDYAMVFRNVPSAVRLLTEGTDEAFLHGLAGGAVRFDGDLAFGMWFNDLLKKSGSMVRRKIEALRTGRSQ